MDRDPAKSRNNPDAPWPVRHGGFILKLTSSRFWFESFQNWRSEFLAIWAMVVLSIWLRQRGSPEPKPVDSPHSETGGREAGWWQVRYD